MSRQSSSCHIDWRPSRLLGAVLVSLGALAAVSVFLSSLPVQAKWPLAAAALFYGLHLARRELRAAAFSLRIVARGGGRVMVFVDRQLLLPSALAQVRGPLAGLSGRAADGRLHRILWWPDTLSSRARRFLRLASGGELAESGPALATIAG